MRGCQVAESAKCALASETSGEDRAPLKRRRVGRSQVQDCEVAGVDRVSYGVTSS